MTRYASTLFFIFVTLVPFKSFAKEGKRAFPMQKAPSTVLLERMDNLTTTVQIVRLINSSKTKGSNLPPSLEVRDLKGASFWEMPEIRAIHFTEEKRISMVSDPSSTMINPEEFSYLISNGYHWYEWNYDDTSWEKPVLAHPNYRWFYIPGASWIWRQSSGPAIQSEILLLRRRFNVPGGLELRRAILYITLDEILYETYINGRALSLKNITMEQNYLALDVTTFIQKGDNLLAMKLGKKAKEEEIFAGIAFRLDIYTISPGEPNTEIPDRAFSDILLENGDHIFGEAISISDRLVEIQTPYNKIKIDRDWVRRIGTIPPYSGNRKNDRKSIFQKIFGARMKNTGGAMQAPGSFSFIIHPEDGESRIGILLKSGEFIKGRIIKLDKGEVIFKPRYGKEVSIVMPDIKYIYPNEPGKIPYLIYPKDDMPWKCRIITLDNTEISGLLTHLTPDTLTIKPPYSEAIRLKNSRLVSCFFPYSSIAGLRKRLDLIKEEFHLSVALMGENDPKGPPYEHSLHFNLHNILIELGIEDNLLMPEEIVDSRIFFPKRFPLMFNIDETETYYKTIHTPNDGYKALLNYVKGGGSLVHMAVGIPDFYGYEPQNRHWKRTTSPPYLNEALSIKILGPSEVSEQAQAFEMPDNKPFFLYFELNTKTPYSYGLPERIEFPFHQDTRFRPIIGDEASTTTLFTPIYRLKSENGTNYGAAMAIIDYRGEGFKKTRCFYVSPLIFTAQYQDHPVLYDLVPKIISLGLPEITFRK